MMKWAVVYSSVTGNTRQIAEAIAQKAGDADIFRVQDAPQDLSAYDVVAIGYWLRLGQPDPLTLKYLAGVRDAKVVFFQTHGTAPDSEHAITSFARAGYHLGEGCEILGTFGCRGKINPAMLEKRKNAGPDDPHGGPQSEERWRLAASHPDAQDIAAAQDFVDRMEHKLVMKARFAARQAEKLAALQQKK
ncbi:MAG: flavodoxin [Selenomonas ruminantium]|jgi:flavodoxin|nr:flavodoxin [Selenomonas ruminantium]